MATEKEIEQALKQLQFKTAGSTSLQESVGFPKAGPEMSKWKDDFEESMLDTPINIRRLLFKRDSVESPWRFVGEE